MQISKTVMAVGGVVVAAAAIGFTNPKTVHALAAALVQVTNTAANPVVSSDVTENPPSILELSCAGGDPCGLVQPGGFPTGTTYLVPPGQSLVITDMEFHTATDSSSTSVGITGLTPGSQLHGVTTMYLIAPDDGLTHVLQMQRGSVFASGQELLEVANSFPGPVVLLHGYLANAVE